MLIFIMILNSCSPQKPLVKNINKTNKSKSNKNDKFLKLIQDFMNLYLNLLSNKSGISKMIFL